MEDNGGNKRTESEQRIPTWKKIVFAAVCIAALMGFVLGGIIYSKRLTYQEYEEYYPDPDGAVIEIPYTYLYRFSLSADERETGLCDVALRDTDSGEILYFWPNVQVPCFEEGVPGVRALPTRLRDKIRAKKLGTKCTLEVMRQDGREVHWTSFKVYGGNPDGFWLRVWIFYALFFAALLLRVRYLMKRGLRFTGDALFVGMVTAMIYFVMMSCFLSTNFPTVIDENDNVLGGMLLAGQHRVIYRDYYTQHTPVVYWLCGLYALLGAGSVQQMRLLFFISEALVYGLLVIRSFSKPYRFRLAAALVLTGPLAVLVSAYSASQILSDTVQGVALSVLLLEFAGYLSDHKLDGKRGLIAGTAVFFSVGAAFLSVFSVAACLIAVISEEIRYRLTKPFAEAGLHSSVPRRSWRDAQHGAAVPSTVRVCGLPGYYLRFAAAAFAPMAAGVLYLVAAGAWPKAVELAYRFNVEVYTATYESAWTFKLQPILDSVENIISLFPQTLSEYGKGGTSFLRHGVECALLVIAGGTVLAILLRKRCLGTDGAKSSMGRRAIAALGIAGIVIPCAARGTTRFHSLPLWFVVLLVCFVGTDLCEECGQSKKRRFSARLAVNLLLLLLALPMLYMQAEYERKGFGDLSGETVRPDTHKVLELTEEGDAIFLEASRSNPNYLIWKKRIPCNRLLWILPWYMEWYEQDMIDDLHAASPKAGVYIENQKIWGKNSFSKALDAAFRADYKEEWDTIWVRNDLAASFEE